KLTLPIFNLLESEDEEVESAVRSSLEDRANVDYEAISKTPAYKKAIADAVSEAMLKTEEAREILWSLPQTTYREALAEMTFYMDELLEDCCS
ncbi:MAG: hypothetical protein RSD12_08925, partial [Akkermansia sp.]